MCAFTASFSSKSYYQDPLPIKSLNFPFFRIYRIKKILIYTECVFNIIQQHSSIYFAYSKQNFNFIADNKVNDIVFCNKVVHKIWVIYSNKTFTQAIIVSRYPYKYNIYHTKEKGSENSCVICRVSITSDLNSKFYFLIKFLQKQNLYNKTLALTTTYHTFQDFHDFNTPEKIMWRIIIHANCRS